MKGSKADIYQAWLGGLKLPPQQTVSEWADTNRVLPPESAIKGQWRTSNAPYQREPMDVGQQLDVKKVVMKWGSQLGKTEVYLNIIGKHMDTDPCTMMYVMPDIGMAKEFSDDRIKPLTSLAPSLAQIFGQLKTRDAADQKGKKSFPGGYLSLVGSNSASGLSSKAVKAVFLDEVDKFKGNIGKDGDPIKQAIQRTTTFYDAEVYETSTPSLKGNSRIDKSYEKSDQRIYEVPCPHCDTYQFLEFFGHETENGEKTGGVIWPEGQPEKAQYHCHECGSGWTQKQIKKAVQIGRWRATKPFNGVAGFYINSLYGFSPQVQVAALAKEWEDVKGNPNEEQTFYNLKLGLSYDTSKRAEINPNQLIDRKEGYDPRIELPEEVLKITAGVDVQHDRLEIQWLGWGAGDEIWVLDWVKIFGDPSDFRLWDDLEKSLLREFTLKNGRKIRAAAVGIDSGYLASKVYEFTDRNQVVFRDWFAIKGMPGWGKPMWKLSGTMLRKGAKLHHIGVWDAKTELYTQLAKKQVEPGYVHFPTHLDDDYFDQLLAAEMKAVIKNNSTEIIWTKPQGKRFEAHDTFLYAKAVRQSLSIDYEHEREYLYRDNEDEKIPTLEDLAGAFN